jgi:hypothetical protein
MAGVFRELDKVTPITIGSTTEPEMDATGSDLVDAANLLETCLPCEPWYRSLRAFWKRPKCPWEIHSGAGSPAGSGANDRVGNPLQLATPAAGGALSMLYWIRWNPSPVRPRIEFRPGSE